MPTGWIRAITVAALGVPVAMSLHVDINVRADEPGIVESEFVFQEAPFASCHASTIAETPTGLVASWFGGSDEGNPDVGTWVARRGDEGWSAPVLVADGNQRDGPRVPCWNPVLHQAADGPLLLFYKVGPSPREWWGMVIESEDHGQTWSEPSACPTAFSGRSRTSRSCWPMGPPVPVEHRGPWLACSYGANRRPG